MIPITRRTFLSAALVGLTRKSGPTIAGGLVHESQDTGHAIRDRLPFPAPRETRRAAVVIVGGGIAGLSAGWRLAKQGMADFV
ncbi:MAG: NAD(P)-binding protein, partial [Vicinamibacterales bacterium]